MLTLGFDLYQLVERLEPVKYFVDSPWKLSIGDSDEEPRTPVWNILINGKSYKQVLRPHLKEDEFEKGANDLPFTTSCETIQ